MTFEFVRKTAGRLGLVCEKHLPEILTYTGLLGFGATIVLACKETKKLDKVVEINTVDINATKSDHEGKDSYKRELTLSYLRGATRIVKLYGPSISLGVASGTAILAGHNILNKRNVAIAAAYSAVEDGFAKYRKRVVDELGEEVDRKFRFGGEDIKVTEDVTDEKTGKTKKKKVTHPNYVECSDYARFFDSGSIKWTKNAEANLFTLKQLERYANETLQARGHVFLNEVYDMLDIPRTQAGAVVGWILGDGNQNYISFGLYDLDDEAKRRFINGLEENILLDFNVDGLIYNKI